MQSISLFGEYLQSFVQKFIAASYKTVNLNHNAFTTLGPVLIINVKDFPIVWMNQIEVKNVEMTKEMFLKHIKQN